MKYYLIMAIDIIKLGNVEILKQYENKADAEKKLMIIALNLVKLNGGERQLKYAIIGNKTINEIANSNVYPIGYYAKNNDTTVEIYEKFSEPICCFRVQNKIHLIKVISVTCMESTNVPIITCVKGSLHRSSSNTSFPAVHLIEPKLWENNTENENVTSAYNI